MHDEIKRFALDGQISDANLIEGKARLVGFLEAQMRDSGHVPALDLDPQFTLDYDRENDVHNFVLSVYGIHIGREKAICAAGIMAGKTVTRSIPKAK